jgi:hypothetical protein
MLVAQHEMTINHLKEQLRMEKEKTTTLDQLRARSVQQDDLIAQLKEQLAAKGNAEHSEQMIKTLQAQLAAAQLQLQQQQCAVEAQQAIVQQSK